MRLLLIIITIFFIPMVYGSEHKLTIIVNQHAPITQELSVQTIKNIFLLKKLSWSDTSRIVVVNRKSGSFTRNNFEEKLNLSSKKYTRYLKKMHYKGVTLPVIRGSKKAVLEFVEKVPGAIAYIEGNVPDNTHNIKVIGALE
ncbi:MAG: substrate-binding domain-containing protein [Pseudomonadota bacterium]